MVSFHGLVLKKFDLKDYIKCLPEIKSPASKVKINNKEPDRALHNNLCTLSR